MSLVTVVFIYSSVFDVVGLNLSDGVSFIPIQAIGKVGTDV